MTVTIWCGPDNDHTPEFEADGRTWGVSLRHNPLSGRDHVAVFRDGVLRIDLNTGASRRLAEFGEYLIPLPFFTLALRVSPQE